MAALLNLNSIIMVSGIVFAIIPLIGIVVVIMQFRRNGTVHPALPLPL